MLNFRELTLQDRTWLRERLFPASKRGCEYSFANLYLWGSAQIAELEGEPLLFSRYGRWSTYYMPLGGDVDRALLALRQDAKERGVVFRVFGVAPEERERMERLFPAQLRFYTVRDSADYVYDIERLCTLKGRKLQSKRNHCNHFEAAYPSYRLVPLTQEEMPRCEAFLRQWYHQHNADHPYAHIEGEVAVLKRALAARQALEMEGALLEVDGQIVAFTMGNRIRADMFDVNFEKAVPQMNGAYPIINRDFARYIAQKHPEVRWINREDDMGLEGLRKAKESYFPDLLLEKTVAEEEKI